MRRVLAGGIMLALAIVLAGCFETTLNIGSADNSKVEPGYCGKWKFTWKENSGEGSAVATLCNFDGRQYFIEWKESEQKIEQFGAFFVPFKEARFAQLHKLGSELPEKHTIMRVALKDGKLGVRQLKAEFFEGVSTDDALRLKIEANIDNEAMYNGDWIWATPAGE